MGFALLLKFFQTEGHFPANKNEVPEAVIEYVARQTQVAPTSWAEYGWQGRTIKYHRAEIRALWGFREATIEDCEALMTWLREHVLAHVDASGTDPGGGASAVPGTPDRTANRRAAGAHASLHTSRV